MSVNVKKLQMYALVTSIYVKHSNGRRHHFCILLAEVNPMHSINDPWYVNCDWTLQNGRD